MLIIILTLKIKYLHMKKVYILLYFLFLISDFLFCQSVGIGTTSPNPKSLLDITSTSKGLLIPRLSTAQRTTITTPPIGLMVYDSTAQSFFYYDGSAWQNLVAASRTWVLNGNTGTNPAVNFIGTSDNSSLQFRVNNIKAGLIDPNNKNVLLGTRAGLNLNN